jgi:acyl-CoA hydrolase
VFPGQLEDHRTYFGGAALSLMSRAAYVRGESRSPAYLVMAACERVEVCCPAQNEDLAEATATAKRVGRRSMTGSVDVIAECSGPAGAAELSRADLGW